MVPRGRGTILFTGATASLRGGSGFAGFSGAKAGLRMLAQSMARELQPKNIHVAHVVIDGPIDTEFVRGNFPRYGEEPACRRAAGARRHRRELLEPARAEALGLDARA